MPPSMDDDFEQYIRGVLGGSRRGLAPAALRMATAAAEPFYAGAMRLRNALYDTGVKSSTRLPRPVVSIGNITTGGTGKTPAVRWLAGRLRDAGRKVAVLSRGYKAGPETLGDEQQMLDQQLNGPGLRAILLRANPSRVSAARDALNQHPDIDVFLLDDAFQHRRVARDFDLVLLNATEPFGFGHVLPRGMLREPLGGVKRASGFLLTHADAASPEQLQALESRLRKLNPTTPFYRARHAPAGLRSADVSSAHPANHSLDDLRSTRFFAFCGLANPQSFHRELSALGDAYAGHRWFPDHYRYTANDLAAVRAQAVVQRADVLVTTEKDWVKLAGLPGVGESEEPIWRLDVELSFLGDDEQRLYQQIQSVIRG